MARASWALRAAWILIGWSTAAAACQAQATQQRVDTMLRERLLAAVNVHHGKIALFASQLNTGKTVSIDATIPVQTASVIKLGNFI